MRIGVLQIVSSFQREWPTYLHHGSVHIGGARCCLGEVALAKALEILAGCALIQSEYPLCFADFVCDVVIAAPQLFHP